MKVRRFPRTLALALPLLTISASRAQQAQPLLQLQTSTAQSVFHIGERIPLTLTFSAADTNRYEITISNSNRQGCLAPDPTAKPPVAGSCFLGSEASSLLSTLTVYHEGLGTGKWLVTAPSATGTPNVLDCGTDPIGGGSICTATYPVLTNGAPTVVTLTATGDDFGGWSYNCMNSTTKTPDNLHGPYYCTVNLISDETVGVIFDNPEQ